MIIGLVIQILFFFGEGEVMIGCYEAIFQDGMKTYYYPSAQSKLHTRSGYSEEDFI